MAVCATLAVCNTVAVCVTPWLCVTDAGEGGTTVSRTGHHRAVPGPQPAPAASSGCHEGGGWLGMFFLLLFFNLIVLPSALCTKC